ncbi:MAG TPA: tRNA (adenosine(37)-N6)-threonylcarbamoyltransferase complex dimerization subunit type 1 TsaB [Gemmatimonadales bacterium]
MTDEGLWLAIDGATDLASVALGSATRVRAAPSVQGARRHAAQIVSLVQQVLEVAAARLEALAGIVVGDGPGSFTGLRIAWAAAKALAHDRGLPVYAVPSLMAAAYTAARGEPGPIAVAFDALRGQVFGAVYGFPPGRVETLVAPGLFTVRQLLEASPVPPVAFVADAAVAAVHAEVVRLDALPPVAGALLALRGLDGPVRLALDPAAEPTYGRPAEAQAKWEALHGRPLPHSPR